MVKNKVLKILLVFVIAFVLVFNLCVSSFAIGASWGVNGYTATSTMPLKSIRVNDTKGIYSQYTDNTDLYFCLADYMQYTRMQDRTRYSIQVPPYPQFDGNPGSTINNFIVYNNVFESNALFKDAAIAYCDNSMLPSNSSERYYVNPFNSKVVQFKFDDFAIFDDQDDPGNGNYWFYYDYGSIDYYTVRFTVKLFDDNGRFVSDFSYIIESDFNLSFMHDQYDRSDALSSGLVAMFDYYNFSQIIGDVGTTGYYISDLEFTVYHHNVSDDSSYTDDSGYASSLTRDSDRTTIDRFFSENVQTKFIGIGDISLFDWLVNAVGSFFDFEFIPGISIGGVIYVGLAIGLFMVLIRIFKG